MARTSRVLAGVAVLAWSIVGCAASPPTAAKSDAVAAVRSARELGAEDTPQASYHLGLALEQLRVADDLIERGDMDAAERMLWRAESDAELAIALTREAQTVEEAEKTRQRIRQMREQYL